MVLAWQERKNKLILFGVIALILMLCTGATIDRLPGWAAESLGLSIFAFALLTLGIALKRVIGFVSQKVKRS
jgi:hypothetical protein